MAVEGRIILVSALVAVAAFLCIFMLRPLAYRCGLVDQPSSRKRHNGDIPLIGGLSIFFGMSVGVISNPERMTSFDLSLFATVTVITLMGAIDDRFDLSAKLRMVVQIVIILVMVKLSGVYIHTLGTYFGHDLALGWLGVPFTVIAVAGLLNAFNMMDGFNGLCGGLAIISVIFITVSHGAVSSNGSLLLIFLMGIGLIPYLAFNLGLFGGQRRIFLGDAGSTMVGYVVAWSLIFASQYGDATIRPTTVPWFVAIPVMDALLVMGGRTLTGKSPLSPDRGHIHHILQDLSFKSSQILLMLISASVALGFLGVLLSRAGQAYSLLMFLIVLLIYAALRLFMLHMIPKSGGLGQKIKAFRISRKQTEKMPIIDATIENTNNMSEG